jgi:hypothetical protein
MLHSTDDPADLTPDQRRREIAAILARGVLRLHWMLRAEAASVPTGDAPEADESRFEASATTRPHVTGS